MEPKLNPIPSRRDARAYALLALLLLLVGLAALFWPLRREEASLARARSGSGEGAFTLAEAFSGAGAEARTPSASAERGEPGSAPQDASLSFDDVYRLLGQSGARAARRFERAVLLDPSIPTDVKAGLLRSAERQEDFLALLRRLAELGGPALRRLGKGLLGDPAAAERLREALSAEAKNRLAGDRLLVKAVDGAQRGAPARPARSGRSTSDEAHHAVGLRVLRGAGKSADIRRYVASAFAAMPAGSRDQIAALCLERGICDPGEACAAAGLIDQCAQACRQSGRCGGEGVDPAAEPAPEEELGPRQQVVSRMYRCVLGRKADQAGMQFWSTSESDLYRAFYQSLEFSDRGLNDDQLVANLYDCALQRAPAPADTEYWRRALATGAPRADVIESFLKSNALDGTPPKPPP